MESVSAGRNRPRSLTRGEKGTRYEQMARCYLEQAGLRFIAANVFCRGGELDLIMQDRACWVFVEVRYRHDGRFGGAAASITWRKQQKLLRAAAYWLAARQASFDTVDCRFDIVAITGQQLQWLPDAFHLQV